MEIEDQPIEKRARTGESSVLAGREDVQRRESKPADHDLSMAIVPRDHRVIIALSLNPKPPTVQHGDAKQATFADLRWDAKKLKTEEEKREFNRRGLEAMRAEMIDERIERELDERHRAEIKKQNARDRQRRHRALQKELNPKLAKPKKTINDVSV